MIIFPRVPFLPTSIVQFSTWYYHVPFVFLQTVFIYYITSSIMSLYFLNAFPGIDMLYCARFVIRELRLYLNHYDTKGNLRTVEEFTKLYRAFQILHHSVTDVWSPLVVPAHSWLFVAISSLGLYIGLRFTGIALILGLAVGTNVLNYLIFVFTKAANLRESWETTLRSWRRQNHSLYFRKFLKSCQPEKINVGSLYFCDKGMVMTMIECVFKNTITLLTTF
ncbi:unnamed protein product [Allacma fusca]|uniref:Uncharacterized protein n=1 Tax=Allacma fusca TaxID=39272 RepID=A0A8J2L0S7_9HEXA|nr:unnamed protein product [Allacma fusca]